MKLQILVPQYKETSMMYSEQIDCVSCAYIYEETDIPIEKK